MRPLAFCIGVAVLACGCSESTTGGGDSGIRLDGGASMDDAQTPVDAGESSDAGTITGDGGTTDGGPFDGGPPALACEFVDTLDDGCGTDENCSIGIHQTDCCGNAAAIGFNHSERDRFDRDEPL